MRGSMIALVAGMAVATPALACDEERVMRGLNDLGTLILASANNHRAILDAIESNGYAISDNGRDVDNLKDLVESRFDGVDDDLYSIEMEVGGLQ